MYAMPHLQPIIGYSQPPIVSKGEFLNISIKYIIQYLVYTRHNYVLIFYVYSFYACTLSTINYSSDLIFNAISSFHSQPKAEWSARLGTVRLSSTSPWEQERRIVGMIKSPVEGTTVLVKLDRPVTTFSDFVRPVCLPSDQDLSNNATQCNTLGWARNRALAVIIYIHTYVIYTHCLIVRLTIIKILCFLTVTLPSTIHKTIGKYLIIIRLFNL